MAQNLTSEVAIKQYLLGQLPEAEQEIIEERFFSDPEFSEEILLVEEELFDDYVLGLLPAHERKNFKARVLSVPQQRQKLELAKALGEYTSRAASLNTDETIISYVKNRITTLRRFLSRLSARKQTVANSPGESAAVQSREDVTWKRLLGEAQTNRNLLTSLIEEDWQGLYLLAQLSLSSPTRESELASESGLISRENVASTLSQLVQCGLVDERQGNFSCTTLGTELLQKLEKSSGVSLS